MSRGNNRKERLSESVANLVQDNGGWLDVLALMTNTYDAALNNVGKAVDCPFPNRHGRGMGKGDFRFSDDPLYAGRAICSCMQHSGMSAVELLMEDGFGRGDWTKTMLEIFKALSPETSGNFVRKDKAPIKKRSTPAITQESRDKRKKQLTLIARDLVSLSHPSALPARRYFARRGIAINSKMLDVRFHPSLAYWEDGAEDKKVLVGNFPAIVSAFRSPDGRVVNFHRIFINEDGTKADVAKVKKICAPLPGFKGSSINVAKTESRILHVTEGVEKAWAVHLVTGESVKAAYSCGSLPSLHVDKSEYDRVVIWSDNDPVIPDRKRDVGDGQYFAWKLACRLSDEGFDVTFMMVNNDTDRGKGPDWEDVIVKEGVLNLEGSGNRVNALRGFAAKGGVSRSHTHAA